MNTRGQAAKAPKGKDTVWFFWFLTQGYYFSRLQNEVLGIPDEPRTWASALNLKTKETIFDFRKSNVATTSCCPTCGEVQK